MPKILALLKATNWRLIVNIFVSSTMVIATAALALLIFYRVRPVRLLEIRVPVTTTKQHYYPGEEISGTFFGEVFYSGDVRVLRTVYCPHLHVVMSDEDTDPDELFNAASIPRKLDGLTARIGVLPLNLPVGEKCQIEFINIYDISTPFGSRHESVSYYTAGFEVIARPADAQITPQVPGGDGQDLPADQFQHQLPGQAAPSGSAMPPAQQPTANSSPPTPQRQGYLECVDERLPNPTAPVTCIMR